MKTINAKDKTMKEAFSQAMKLGEDIKIKCSDGSFMLKGGILMKIPKGKQQVLIRHNGHWENIGK